MIESIQSRISLVIGSFSLELLNKLFDDIFSNQFIFILLFSIDDKTIQFIRLLNMKIDFEPTPCRTKYLDILPACA